MIRTASQRAGWLLIQVADTGLGIEPEQATRIFNAFEQGERTVTRRFGGLGLGLTITRSLVSMHSGSISVQSEGKGKGSSFRIELPLLRNSPNAVAVRSSTMPSSSLSLSILLVDDHNDTRGSAGPTFDAARPSGGDGRRREIRAGTRPDGAV